MKDYFIQKKKLSRLILNRTVKIKKNKKTLLDLELDDFLLEGSFNSDLLPEEKKYLETHFEIVERENSLKEYVSIKKFFHISKEKPARKEYASFLIEVFEEFPLLATTRALSISPEFYFLLEKRGYVKYKS